MRRQEKEIACDRDVNRTRGQEKEMSRERNVKSQETGMPRERDINTTKIQEKHMPKLPKPKDANPLHLGVNAGH